MHKLKKEYSVKLPEAKQAKQKSNYTNQYKSNEVMKSLKCLR